MTDRPNSGAEAPTGTIARRSLWRSDRFGLLALALITLAAASHLFWGGTIIGQDSATQFYPWYDYLGERLSDGDIPGWNPFQLAGAPFAADPQSGWTYLPAMVVFTLLSIPAAVPVFILFHLALAGAGTYALSRLLGIGIGGSLVAAVSYQLAPPVYGRSVCCPAQYEVGSWMPLALVGAELALRSRDLAWRVIGWAIAGLAVSQALAAWLGQGSYYFLLILVAYVGYRGLIATPEARRGALPRRFANTALDGGAILAIGFGLAAAGILPRLEYNARSNVAGGEYGEDNAWAADVGGVTPGMIFDRLLDPTLYYPGVAVLVLAIAALFTARGRHATRFFGALGICAIVLAMPVDTPLHLLLYAVLPKFEQLHRHWPERVAIVSYLCFAMLAGAAVHALMVRRLSPRRMGVAVGLPVIALAVLVVVNPDIPPAPVVVMVLAVGLVASLALPQSRWVRPMLPALLTTIVAVDLLVAFNGGIETAPYGGFHRVDLDEYYAPDGAAAFLRERMAEEPGRYIGFDPDQWMMADGQLVLYRYQFASPDTGALLVNNRGVLHGIEDAQGYNPVQPQRFVEYLTALNGHPQEYHDANVYPAGLDSPLLDLLNIRYIVIPASYPPGRDHLSELDRAFPTIYADDRVKVLENPAALPRAWVVHEAREADESDILSLLAAGEVNPRETALLDSVPPELEKPSGGVASSARLIEGEPELLRVETRTEAPGLLMLGETYDPNWRAWVDGEEVELFRANHLFQAVPIPAGEHVVELRYEPPALRAGLAVSGVTVAFVAPALVWAIRRIRQQGPADSPQRAVQALDPAQASCARARMVPVTASIEAVEVSISMSARARSNGTTMRVSLRIFARSSACLPNGLVVLLAMRSIITSVGALSRTTWSS